MKVFIAHIGEYSDRRILGVFSTRELAEAMFDPPSPENDIEEHELDGPPSGKDAVGTVFKVTVRMDTGEVLHTCESAEQLRARDHANVRFSKTYSLDGFNLTPVAFVEAARSAEFALKLAAEARQEYLRELAITPSPGPTPGRPG